MKKKDEIAALKMQLNEVTVLNANNVQTMADQEDLIRELKQEKESLKITLKSYRNYEVELRKPVIQLRNVTGAEDSSVFPDAAVILIAAGLVIDLESRLKHSNTLQTRTQLLIQHLCDRNTHNGCNK